MPLPPEFHELAKKVNNWGRWGADDERGTLNLITDEVVQRGLACARNHEGLGNLSRLIFVIARLSCLNRYGPGTRESD